MVGKTTKQHNEHSMKQTGHIDIDGFKLRYITEGEGPDVLVIGSSVYYPRSFSQNLRKSLRLHFVDYRGFAEGPEVELTFDTLLDDLEHIRQKLSLKRCIVIGHSAHGLLALEYAKKYKEHVSHVIIIGMPPHMKPDHIAMAQHNWDDSVWPERKAAFERNMMLMPDEKLNQLPREEWFLQMNFRNVPKSWYDYNFDSTPLWKGVKPNTHILDQMYLRFAREIDVSQGLESFDRPVLLAYGRFEFLVAPVHSWDSLRHKFKNLTVRIFEKSAHSPQYEEANLFDAELLKWLEET
ncbi:MAG: alpha/beta hydrolase [Chlamydiae bacterium]|nr:alpha/beta hydrolase [Chlamydiota bacterium]